MRETSGAAFRGGLTHLTAAANIYMRRFVLGWKCSGLSDPRLSPHNLRAPPRDLVQKGQSEPDAGEPLVRLCVQRRLACSAGERPAGAKIRTP